MASFQALPGFRDFYPAECAARDYIFKVWREVSEQFGFAAYDGPPLEPLDLYKTKSGAEIVHQLYNFTDKGKREISLRPEMTPTLARMAGTKHRDFKKPMKWYTMPQLFRYERAQKGRLREHYQWNCDIIGEEDLGAEAEIIAVMVASFQKFGLTAEDIVVRVSDRYFWTDFFSKNGVAPEKHYDYFQVLDKIDRTEESVTREKLGSLADKVFEIFEKGASSERFDILWKKLDALGILPFVEIDLKIVRGLAYYTGVVFEAHDRKQEFRAIAGGGRYNDLLKLLSGSDLPAIGFGYGDVVILELLKARNLLPAYKPNLDFFIAILDENYRTEALKLVGKLRSHGKLVDYALAPMKAVKQFELAEERGADQVLIIDQKIQENKLSLKKLSTREQTEISVSDVK